MPTILIAEVNASLRAALHHIFELEGYDDVREVTSGPATLHMLRTASQPMIVVFDLVASLHARQFIAALAHEPQLVAHHSFILLTSAYHAYVPPHVEQLSAQILFLPFDIKAFRAAIQHAATSLASAA